MFRNNLLKTIRMPIKHERNISEAGKNIYELFSGIVLYIFIVGFDLNIYLVLKLI